ncbi:MAG: 50S ribosomal protein L25 [Bacteroidales bacterium]|nr:50S ribosomal protein L25 [Bacteroidales bacterium]
MKSVSMSGSLRENVGKKDARTQRASGMIPCVMYGKGEQIHFLVDELTCHNFFYSPEVRYAVININGVEHRAVVQEAQYHPVTDKLLHVDFLEVADDRAINIAIPLMVKGNSPGVMRGGKLSKKVRKVKVHGLLAHIPENITLDISKLDILDCIRVEDVQLENISIVEQPSKVLVSVLPTRNIEDAPAAE